MFVHYRTLALNLKQEERGEADYLFTAFSKDFGKLRVLGRGIRKTKAKLRAGIPLFSQSEIEFIEGRNYKTLTDAILVQDFGRIKKSLPRLKIAQRIAGVVSRFISGEERDEQIWQLLLETLGRLNNPQLTINHQQRLFFYFFWNFFSILGYAPELYHCLLCQKRLEPTQPYFSPSQGGVICQSCGKMRPAQETIKIDPRTIKILRKILERDWSVLVRLKMRAGDFKSIRRVSGLYLDLVAGQQ